MSTRQWILEQEPRWQRLESLLDEARTSMKLLSQQELRELSLLYREAVTDLARVQALPEARHLEPYLNNLVQRCHGRIYEKPPASWQDVSRFFTHDFPGCFRKNLPFICLAFATFMLGALLASLTLALDPETQTYFLPPSAIENLQKGVLWMDRTTAHPAESSFLMTNNIRVAINAYTAGIMFGVGTLAILLHNGMFAFGGPLSVCFAYGMGFRLLNFILPHGVIELTTIFIAGGAGMIIGFALLFPGDRPRWEAVREKGRESLILIMGCIPLLVIAGIIEGMISLNREVDTPIRMGVSLLSAICLFSYLAFAGRPAAGSAPPPPGSY